MAVFGYVMQNKLKYILCLNHLSVSLINEEAQKEVLNFSITPSKAEWSRVKETNKLEPLELSSSLIESGFMKYLNSQYKHQKYTLETTYDLKQAKSPTVIDFPTMKDSSGDQLVRVKKNGLEFELMTHSDGLAVSLDINNMQVIIILTDTPHESDLVFNKLTKIKE